MKSAPKRISPRVAVALQPPEISSTVTEYSVVATDFVRKPLKKSRAAKAQKHEIAEDDFLIIGFDTEYQIPDDPVTKVEVEAGTARYTVLSYQFCVIHGPEAKWSGIAIPPSGTRLSMGELIILALASRPSKWSTKFPRLIYLVGHYTKADVPAFSDFKDIKQVVSAVRGSFVTVDMDTSLLLDFPEDDDVELQIKFRDTCRTCW